MSNLYTTVSGVSSDFTTVSGIYISPELENRMRILANYVIDRIIDDYNNRGYKMMVN